MNNKLFARIMTAVICICMMSTVCFAAAPELVDGDDATTKKINFVDGTSNWLAAEGTADQVTMMAYLVPAGTAIDAAAYVDETNTPMIAIDQYDGDALATTVSVLASKLVEGKDIVLQKGDSNGGGAKMIIAQTVIEDKVVVTVMNGADAIKIEAGADGKVTLPTTTAFNKTVNTGYTFTLYSWVTADGATEYKVADAPVVDATALEGKTLYAKYVTNIVIGDTNGNGTLEATDRTFLYQYTVNNRNVGKMGKTFAELTGVADLAGIVGDTNGNGTLEATDRTFLYQYTVNNRNVGKMGTGVYYVNK